MSDRYSTSLRSAAKVYESNCTQHTESTRAADTDGSDNDQQRASPKREAGQRTHCSRSAVWSLRATDEIFDGAARAQSAGVLVVVRGRSLLSFCCCVVVLLNDSISLEIIESLEGETVDQRHAQSGVVAALRCIDTETWRGRDRGTDTK